MYLSLKFDSFLTPVLSSVQNFQTSIKNAPDNVIGIVKGLSDNIITNTVESINKIRVPNATNGTNEQPTISLSSIKSQNENNQTVTNGLDKDIMIDDVKFNHYSFYITFIIIILLLFKSSSNYSLKVLLVLMDEIFDLKEKNQWLRQSLITIIKGFLKNFKGDSMTR